MIVFIYLYAALAGCMNSVQAGANAGLGKALDNKLLAGVIVLAMSCGIIAVMALFGGRLTWPGSGKFAAVPWWAWTGGLLSAGFILSQLYTAERMGSAVFMTVTVTAAVLTSLALDHWGLVGFKEHPFGWGRAAGALLIVAGLGLISAF